MDPAPATTSPIAYDDRRVEVSTDLIFGAPNVVTAGGGADVIEEATGSRYGVSLTAAGVPGVNGGTRLGPTVRYGGLSLGLLASGLFDGRFSVAPQLGIGGVTLSPQGLCAGFWCAGPAGVGLLSPAAMGILGGSLVIRDVMETEREDAESLPLVLASDLASSLIPIPQIQEALTTLGVDTGGGPSAKRIDTVPELISFRSAIERMIVGNQRSDAVGRLNEALALPQDPFVAAELRELRDRALFEQNARGIPSRDIESNIRCAIEAMERFDGRDFETYLSNALYLARKLQFFVDSVEEDGQTVLKIRKSSPFQIGDPELALRYVEVVARFYADLSRPDTPLLKDLRERTESRARSLLIALDRRPFDREAVLEVDAALAWHISWIQSASLLYQEGFFHRRLQHIRWMVRDTSQAAEVDRIPYPEIADVAGRLQEATVSGKLSPDHYQTLKVGIDALRTMGELSRERFPDEMGDGSLLFDRERARGWARRRELIDGLYSLAAVHQALRGDAVKSEPELRSRLVRLFRESERQFVDTMRANPAEVRREWFRYWLGFPSSLQTHVSRRLEDASDALEDFHPSELVAEYRAFRALIADASASRFQTDEFGSFPRLFEVEARESARINEVTTAFQGLLARSQGLPKEGHQALQEASLHLRRVRENYERFNARRVGRFFMTHYVRLAGIDPYDFHDNFP